MPQFYLKRLLHGIYSGYIASGPMQDVKPEGHSLQQSLYFSGYPLSHRTEGRFAHIIFGLFGFNVTFRHHEVISRRCLLVAAVLRPIWCHRGMPCCRHRTWYPTLSQYTDTGQICRCAIHWCETSHWNTQLPISMSWVRPDRKILPPSSTNISQHSILWCCYVNPYV